MKIINKSAYLVGFQLSVLNAINLALFEYHLVLCERAGLITEYHLDLAELLDEVGVPTLRVSLRLDVKHLDVLVDEGGLPELQDLYHHIEGDGDHVRVGHPEDEELREKDLYAILWLVLHKLVRVSAY